MGSVYSSGYYADVAHKTRQSQCEKSEDKKHEWIEHGSWPSTWGECKHCKETYFDK